MLCQTTSDQKTLETSLKSQTNHLNVGLKQEKLTVLEQKEDTVDTISPNYSQKLKQESKNVSATQEFLPTDKRKIWKPSLSSSKLTTLTTRASKILDRALTSKGKAYCPYWTIQSQEISQKLLLPTETDCADSDLKSSNESWSPKEEGSWFSIRKNSQQNRNSSRISSLLQPCSALNSTVCVVTHSEEKLGIRIKYKKPTRTKKKYKTLKVRLFPTENEEKKLLAECAHHRWYYNAFLDVFDMKEHLEKLEQSKKDEEYADSVSWRKVRDSLRKYEYIEELKGNFRWCEFKYDEKRDSYPKPNWIEDSKGNIIDNETHNRVIRGAAFNLAENINSASSNYVNGNIEEFSINWKTSKNKKEMVYFEDNSYPKFHKNIRGRYSYRLPVGESKRRTSILWSDLLELHPKNGFVIIKDKDTNTWYGCLSVEREWYPPSDYRSENQRPIVRDNAISLDPGVRKFLTGYSNTGETILYGDKAYKELTPLLYKIDKIDTKIKHIKGGLVSASEKQLQNLYTYKCLMWLRVKNLVRDLHWKCIRNIVLNYDYIFLGDIRIQSCVKDKKLPKIIKRLLNQFSFFQFKQRLEYMCEKINRKLILVNEALTTKTCSNCGTKNNIGSSETYTCSKCNHTFDRDINSAKNILIKGITVLNSSI